uniref:kelch-like protein 22 isoform X1 n=1 Tax=Myxine glutinosa TaxID=7769 RepID=UPI00358FAE1F
MAKALIATLMDKAAAAKSKETSDAQTRMVTQRLPKSRQLFLSIEHASGLLAGLAELQASSSMYDVTLRVEGRPLKAHRVVLAAACEYFRGMFARGLKEARQEEIIIHEVRFSAMEKLIRFIYTAELELSVEEVQDVLMASVLLQLSPVIEFCCDFLMSWVEAENIPELYQLADVYGLRQLAKQLDTYLLENFSSFSRTDAYRHLPMEKVRFLLNSDKLQVSSEREVFQAALLYHHSTGIPGGSTRGLKQDEDYDCFDEDDETNLMWRRALANPPKLLECVRYALLSSRMVQSLYSRLNPCPLKEILADALAYHSNEMLQPVLQTWQTRLRSTYRCVVGFGGMYSTEDNDLNDEAKFLNPKTQRWQTFQPAGRTPRLSNQGIAVINDFVFLVGGDNNTHGFRAVSDCWRYDPRHNKWSSIAPLQQEHADHCLCAVGSFLYVVGGRDYVTELREVERYSLETNSWEYVQPLPRESYAHAGVAYEDKIFVSCGAREDVYLPSLLCYEPETNKWHQRSPAPVERAWHGMAVAGHLLYLLGGSNRRHGSRRDVLQVHTYEPANDTWSSVAPLPTGHGEPGISVLSKPEDGEVEIYVVGGRSHDVHGRTADVHVFSVKCNSWELCPELEDELSGMACSVLTMPQDLLARVRESPEGRAASSRAYEGSSSISDFDFENNDVWLDAEIGFSTEED